MGSGDACTNAYFNLMHLCSLARTANAGEDNGDHFEDHFDGQADFVEEKSTSVGALDNEDSLEEDKR